MIFKKVVFIDIIKYVLQSTPMITNMQQLYWQTSSASLTVIPSSPQHTIQNSIHKILEKRYLRNGNKILNEAENTLLTVIPS